MIVLFFGDIVGDEATRYLGRRMPQLREYHRADLVIANAENCAPNGLGMTVQQVAWLRNQGVDVITGGNHSWDSDDSVAALANPRVVRPANVGPDIPGRGTVTVPTDEGPVTVINLADECAMRSVQAIEGTFSPAYGAWLAAPKQGTVIVDYHGDHVLEKQIFARAVDGEAAAVLGTHTHEATLPLHVLPGGTALVTDVGMTGPMGGVQGFGYDLFVAGLARTGNPFALGLPRPVAGPITVGGVLLEIDGGKTLRLERMS